MPPMLPSLLVMLALVSMSAEAAEAPTAFERPERMRERRRADANPMRAAAANRRRERATGSTPRSSDVRAPSRARPEPTAAPESGEPIEIFETEPYGTYGVRVTITNLETEEVTKIATRSGDPLPSLKPGRYKLLTEASRLGFPQEATYQVIDARTEEVVELFARSHVAVTNVVIEPGQRLRVTVLGSIRPYNAVFYHLGPEKIPVAHLFARPYPSQDFDPGAFNGTEQFSASPIAIAFWGMKISREQPELRERIEREGVAGVRQSERIRDPVLVLGVRKVASDLADVFVRDRGKDGEDYRGQHHVTFLILRTDDGKVPGSLLAMDRPALATAFERQLLWMMRHNVHRPAEGGGYAGKTFEDDLAEAKEKVKRWPLVSRESTELIRDRIRAIEARVEEEGLDVRVTLADDDEGRAGDLLAAASRNLIKAAARERMNYARYDPDTLAELAGQVRQEIADRDRELREMIDAEIGRLRLLSPGSESDYMKFQKPNFED